MSLSRPLSRGVSIAARHLRGASSIIGRSSLSSSLFSSTLSLSSPLSSSLRSFHHQSLTAFASPASSAASSGRVEFLLADIGEGIAEVELIKWFVKAGDTIQQFDPVCEVQSDKATVPITSRYDGKIIELKYQPGQIAAVGKALMIIETTAGGESAPATTSPTSSTPSSSPAAPSSLSSSSAEFTSTNAEQFLTSPAVRRLSKEQKVDLSHVQPTGPGGRILKEDVLKFIEASANGQTPKRVAPSTPAPTAAAPRSTPAPVATPAAAPPKDKSTPISPLPQYLSSDITTQVSGLARIMVQTMNAANAVPTFGYGDEVNVEELVKLREAVKGIAEKKYGIKLTYLPFLIKAASLALRRYPQLNAHVNADCTQVTQKADHNIGLAVDTPRGLIVPNIKKVQDRSIFEIGAELQRISALAQQGRLGKEDLTGGTFTLSNIGSIGGTYMSPILVVPEVMIGALGGFQLRPRYDASMNLKATRVMNISWSGDHRVVDGATVARFSNQWKYYIEHPFAMVAELK